MDFGLPPILDVAVRIIVTICVLYMLYAWLDFIYRGNNRYPRLFGALDRGTSAIFNVITLAPFRGRDRD